MTPPLDSRQSARCGRSSLFPEQGDRSPPYPRSLAGRRSHQEGPGCVWEDATCHGHSDQ